MNHPWYAHETWHTSWYWRVGRLEIEVYKPAYRDASLYWVSLRDSDGSPGFYTPLFAVSWLTREE